jgi:hypothetical protein
MTKAEWRASRRVDLRASEDQIRAWRRAARDRSMQLSAWVRLVLDEAARKNNQ